MLGTGTQCEVSDSSCFDSDGSLVFWTPVPEENCKFSSYDVLYEGMATVLTGDQEPTVYTVSEQGTMFAFIRKDEFRLCGYRLQRTEHPKLFILETSGGEKHTRMQMSQLYMDIMTQKCELEKQVLTNALVLANVAMEEVAYSIMKTPGYLAITAGEVLHIIQCVPVECALRKTEDCHWELPVTHRNQSMFLTPRSHILTRQATPRLCNKLLPIMYELHGTWYQFLPNPVESLPPETIDPLTKLSWKYFDPANLATGGVYGMDDLEKFRDHILFSVELSSVLNTLAKGAMGQHIPAGRLNMINLMDEESLTQIAETTSKKIWGWFTMFSSFSTGCMGVYMAFHAIKAVVDTVIHGYALHSVYGWSIYLVVAFWSSITHLLLYLSKSAKETTTETAVLNNTTDNKAGEVHSS